MKKLRSKKKPSMISPKRGYPSTAVTSIASTSPSNLSDVPTQLRSTAPPYNSDLCIICQKEGGILHKVMTTEKGLKLLTVAEKLSDRNFYIRLNSLSDR